MSNITIDASRLAKLEKFEAQQKRAAEAYKFTLMRDKLYVIKAKAAGIVVNDDEVAIEMEKKAK